MLDSKIYNGAKVLKQYSIGTDIDIQINGIELGTRIYSLIW